MLRFRSDTNGFPNTVVMMTLHQAVDGPPWWGFLCPVVADSSHFPTAETSATKTTNTLYFTYRLI